MPTAKRRLANALKKGTTTALPDWAYRLAEWRTEQPKKNIPADTMAVKATELAGQLVTAHEVRKILNSMTFRKYLGWCANDRRAAARHLTETQLLKAVRLRGDALDWARAERAFSDVPKLTDKHMDILFPRTSDGVPAQTNIQINFSDKQREYDAMPELIAETVPVEPEEPSTGH